MPYLSGRLSPSALAFASVARIAAFAAGRRLKHRRPSLRVAAVGLAQSRRPFRKAQQVQTIPGALLCAVARFIDVAHFGSLSVRSRRSCASSRL